MAAEEAEGDRVIEIVSAGSLYRRGGNWERKYWSCSRGKDRYPYPVGYHAVRHFSGISYAMEIQQGPRGPIFLVTSTEGDSATGETPDFAWKNLQKKTGTKVRNLQIRRSFPQKIDGAELFGLKNASVQRLLRELIVDSTGAVELNLPRAVSSEDVVLLAHKDAADVSEAEDLPVCLGTECETAKRSIEPSQLESPAKKVHYQDMFTSVDNCNVSTHRNANERGPAGTALLENVYDSRCTLPSLEEVPGNSKSTSLDDNLGEPSPVSSEQVGLSSGSYLSSEKTDLELAEKEVAKSMMSILLPQAIPLLKKFNKKKKSKRKKKENSTVSVRTTSAHNPSDDRCQGLTVPTIIGEGVSKNSSGTCDHGGSHCERVKNGSTDDDCKNVFKLGKMNDFVADSFEDDAQILGDNTSKSMYVHHHESDDACSRGPNENSKLLYGKTEGHAKLYECQVGVHDGTNAPDVVYDHEKGQYILSDSLLACLEEEFGGEDSYHPANYNQYNGDVEKIQFEQQFNDLTNGTKNGSSVSIDVSYHNKTSSGSVDVSAQAFARNGSAVLRNGECLANVLPPVHSNTYNDAAKWGKHDVSSTSIAPPACEANSSLLDMQDEQDHTKVPAINQKENRLHGVSYKCKKSNGLFQKSNTSCHSDNVEFFDKYVAFEPPEKGRHSNDGSQGVSTTKVWPVGDRPEADKGNVLGKVEECQAGCRNGNMKAMSVSLESNICERIPLKGENDGFHHQPGHTLSVTNRTHGLLSEYTKAQSSRSGHHLELVGCYLHQMPVLSIMLNTKNHSSLYIYVFCGLLESCQRFVHVYTVSKDQQDAPPCFVGYTPLLLPSLDQSCTGNFSFGRSGLQFTPDGQFLVLLSCIRIPFCRMQNIDCLCSVCKLGQCEDNSLKIVSVNLGYVSLITKLMPYGTASCILICEPNYIVVIEDNRNLHIWKMVNDWRDISKRTLLATFTSAGNIVFQILPVGFCSLQDIIHAPVDDIDKKLREIGISGMSRKIDQDHFMMPPRDDIGVWVLISSASVAEYQYDLRTKEHNPRWRLALLAKKRVVMGNILDTRITALDASGNYGFAGTNGGLLYLWELSSGRKLIGVQCFNRGPVSCVAVDAKSGAVAVTDGGCQVLLYTQDKVLTDAGADEHMFRMDKVTAAAS
ncbi:hypothetical protein PAHAL_2G142800 [Panicum hallii]|uniref:Uncharacterized protein n=1 Tax=Panicum hallii TaxID=206008 RepID=A0A2S3GXX1_9POAL|nr:hypothetical protein PAHAL_2G142800 [Panicum hallii]